MERLKFPYFALRYPSLSDLVFSPYRNYLLVFQLLTCKYMQNNCKASKVQAVVEVRHVILSCPTVNCTPFTCIINCFIYICDLQSLEIEIELKTEKIWFSFFSMQVIGEVKK